MNKKLQIKEDAIFVADSHDSHDGEKRDSFLIFLNKLNNQEIKTSQLFLMGDMFDLLTKLDYTSFLYKDYIELLNTISKKIEIHYFEGNHDFLLKEFFTNINIYSIKNQPVEFFYKDKKFLLSHGDRDEKLGYKIYTFFIRNYLIVKFINFLDKNLNYSISKKILNIQYKKNLCKKFDNFEQKIEKKLTNYKDCDFVVEGHFHQGKSFLMRNTNYINIRSLFCNKSFVVFKNDLNFSENSI